MFRSAFRELNGRFGFLKSRLCSLGELLVPLRLLPPTSQALPRLVAFPVLARWMRDTRDISRGVTLRGVTLRGVT